MNLEPIFIVGVQRSGTTLLAAMLAAHSRLSCGPETHFFRRLAQVDAASLCAPDTWPCAAAQFVRSITHTGVEPHTRKSLVDKYRLAPDSIDTYLRTKAPSIPEILRSVTEQHMIAKAKVRWVEKTPDHLLHTAAIREYFPGAPIIHIVRDPRDVALSLMNVPWGVKSLLEGLLYWERLERTSRDFFSTDRLCHTVRFEDLVGSPARELQKICEFIGEAYEEGMLDTSRTGSEINARNAPWKNKVSQAVDVSRLEVWRAELTESENRLAEAVLGDHIEALGYPREATFARLGRIRPQISAAESYDGALGTLASYGLRFWKARPDERSQATVYLGQPGTGEWRVEQDGENGYVLPVLTDIARAAISKTDVYWVPNSDDRRWTGCVGFLLKKCLAPYKVVGSAPRS